MYAVQIIEVFDFNDFIGEPSWDEGGDMAPFFDLYIGVYEVEGIHYEEEYDSAYEDNDEDNEEEEEELEKQ